MLTYDVDDKYGVQPMNDTYTKNDANTKNDAHLENDADNFDDKDADPIDNDNDD